MIYCYLRRKVQMKLSKRYPGLAYDYINGKFYKVAKNSKINQNIDEIHLFVDILTERELYVDETGYLSYKCNISGALVRKKAIILAFEVLHDTLTTGKKTYFKDLNTNNYKGSNIGCVDKDEFVKIKDSLRNLNGFLKVQPHKTDAYVYVVKYRQSGRSCTKLCHDIVQALRFKRRILLKSSKILSKYLTTQ